MNALAAVSEESPASGWVGAPAIEEMLRHQSLECLNQDIRSESARIAEPHRSGPIYGHRLGVILLAGPELRLTLKAFFNVEDITQILSQKIGRPVPKSSGSLLDDYVREYLNRLAGVGKRSLGDAGINVGISLPIVTRGFDEAFSNTSGGLESSTVWAVRDDRMGLIISATTFVKDGEAVGRFQFAVQDHSASDEMEFL